MRLNILTLFLHLLYMSNCLSSSEMTVENSDSRFILITSLYNEVDQNRTREYCECIMRNLAHPRIEKIHIVYDISRDDTENNLLYFLQSLNLTITYVSGRPTFGDIFKIANSYDKKKIIISNGDIYFNDSLLALDDYDLHGKFLALTRWNVQKNGSLELFAQYDKKGKFSLSSYYSQDAWIFQTPLVPFANATMKMGTMTCDSLLAYQAWASGLDTFNPCLTIQCCHLHLSNVRHYDSKPAASKLTRPLQWVHLNKRMLKI